MSIQGISLSHFSFSVTRRSVIALASPQLDPIIFPIKDCFDIVGFSAPMITSRYKEGGYLQDVIDREKGNDRSIRPDQIFSIPLDDPVPRCIRCSQPFWNAE